MADARLEVVCGYDDDYSADGGYRVDFSTTIADRSLSLHDVKRITMQRMGNEFNRMLGMKVEPVEVAPVPHDDDDDDDEV